MSVAQPVPYWRLSAYYFFYFAFIGAFSPYFSLYLSGIRFSAWDIGVVMSLMQVMRLLGPNLWGWLAERLGQKTPIVRMAAAVSLAGFCGFFLSDAFAGVFVAMAVMGFFWSAALPLVETLTLGHLGTHGSRYGAIRLWGSVGFIVAVLGTGAALDFFPLHAVLWAGLLMLAGILACALTVPEAPPEHHAAPRQSLRRVMATREVGALLSACLLMSAGHGALYVFYSILLVDHGYSKTAVGWLWTLGVLAEIAVFWYMPRLLRTFSTRDILLFSFGCAVVRFLVIGWATDQVWLIAAAQLLHGATFGAYHAAAVAAVARLFPGPLQARGQALYGSLSFGAGGMIGGLVSGWAWDGLGSAVTFTLSAGFALLGLLVMSFGWPKPAAVAVAH